MKPVALRVLSCFVCLATSVAVASCEVTPLAQTLSRPADAGKAALDILALIGKSDAGADALRHENTLISFASRAKDLPQSVQEKIWTDEFVSRFREGIQEDNVGFALTDCKDAKALYEWVSEWSDQIDISATPVVEDREGASVLRRIYKGR